jgi:GR25 family glycosyltransferase involved in LPS biosynthesis
VEFVFGVNGKKLSEEEIALVYDSGKSVAYCGSDLNRGEIGCALSHRLVYEKMVRENIERAVVFEDDAVIVDSPRAALSDVFAALERLPIENYIIKLDTAHSKQHSLDNSRAIRFTPWHKIHLCDGYDAIQPFSGVYLTTAYYIDRKAAETMLRLQKKVFLAADAWMFFRRFVKLRLTSRAVIRPDRAMETTIGGRVSGKNNAQLRRISAKIAWLCKSLFS